MVNAYLKIRAIISWNEYSCYKWLIKSRNRCRLSININDIRDIEVFIHLSLVVNHINEENPIILISNGEYSTAVTLLYDVHLQVLSIVLLSEAQIVISKTVASQLKVFILVVDNCNAVLTVVSHYDGDNI